MATANVDTFIPAPVHRVFEILADHEHYDRTHTVTASALLKPGEYDRNGVGAVRELRVRSIRFIEEIKSYAAPLTLEYRVLECYLCVGKNTRQIRFPLVHEKGLITLSEQQGGTHIHWLSQYQVDLPLGNLIACLLRPMVEHAFRGILKDTGKLLSGIA
jgi:hypothetical protein